MAGPRPEPAVESMYLDGETLQRLFEAVSDRPLRERLVGRGLIGALLGLRAIVAGSRWLDARLYPDLAQVEVREPLFVFGNPRSGTTFLHRLLCLDRERFVHLELHHTLFQALVLARLARRIERADERLGRPLDRALRAVERRLFSFWNGVHPLGLSRPEEDEGWFLFSLLTPAIHFLFPWSEATRHIGWLDAAPRPVRERIGAEYRALVQRQLYDFPGRTFLNKSVFLAGRFDTVWTALPDARFVYLVRHPYQSIPSLLSMITRAWAVHSPQVPRDGEAVRGVATYAMRLYRRGWALQDRVPADQYLLLHFDDLVSDPEAAVRRIYATFGWVPSEAFLDRLRAEVRGPRDQGPEHDYALARFGLDRATIRAELGDVMDDLGFAP